MTDTLSRREFMIGGTAVAVVATFGLPIIAEANPKHIYHVDLSGVGLSGDGLSWANALKGQGGGRSAFDRAKAGDTIYFKSRSAPKHIGVMQWNGKP